MGEVDQTDIWNPETGITDYISEPFLLASPEAETIRIEWAQEKSKLENARAVASFTEQLHREWSIETGIIENLYDIDRGVTQTLIEQGFQKSILVHGSINKEPEYILSLLEDQKLALESLFSFVKREQPLTIHFIRELHHLMTNSQDYTEAQDPAGNQIQVPLNKGDWKKHPNFPIRNGTVFRYCPPEQVGTEMEKLIGLHEKHQTIGIPPEVEAAWLHHRFSQIHPFQDGNGRIARALATLVLIRGQMFPFVIPREEKSAYISCLEMADGGDLRPLIRTISRRQEAAHLKAKNAIKLSSSNTSDYLQAASFLGHIVRETTEERSRRLETKIEALSQSMWSVLTSATKAASQTLRKEALLHEKTGLLIATEQRSVENEVIRRAKGLILRETGDFAPDPVSFNFVRVFVLGGAELLFLAYAPLPEASDRVIVRSCLLSPQERLLKLSPWEWSDYEQIDLDSLTEWIQEALRILFLDLANEQ